MQISLNLSGLDEVKKKLESLTGPKIKSAISMAINKTAAKGQTEINRAITERYQISRSEVSNSVTVSTASKVKPTATLRIFGSPKKQGRSLNLIHFTERKVTLAEGRRRAKAGNQNQLRFNIIKGQGGKMIPGAFIGNKGRTVFIREGKSRLPIKPVQVIGVGQMFNFRPITERVIARIKREFLTEVDRAIAQKLRSAR